MLRPARDRVGTWSVARRGPTGSRARPRGIARRWRASDRPVSQPGCGSRSGESLSCPSRPVQHRPPGANGFLERMEQLVPWEELEGRTAPIGRSRRGAASGQEGPTVVLRDEARHRHGRAVGAGAQRAHDGGERLRRDRGAPSRARWQGGGVGRRRLTREWRSAPSTGGRRCAGRWRCVRGAGGSLLPGGAGGAAEGLKCGRRRSTRTSMCSGTSDTPGCATGGLRRTASASRCYWASRTCCEQCLTSRDQRIRVPGIALRAGSGARTRRNRPSIRRHGSPPSPISMPIGSNRPDTLPLQSILSDHTDTLEVEVSGDAAPLAARLAAAGLRQRPIVWVSLVRRCCTLAERRPTD